MTLPINSKAIDSNSTTIKFLYSYNGKIIPRPTDGLLRYSGGFTRVLSVDSSISFAELMIKLGELCGSSMSLKIKLPYEDLDLLVTITNDEELTSAINEYSLVSKATGKDMKIRGLLFPHQSLKKISPPSSPCTVFSPDYASKPPLGRRRSIVKGYQSGTPRYQYQASVVGIPVGGVQKVETRAWQSVRKWNQWL
ncbi:PB1 domain-containing protein [Heracleum sosnowskyi]|uniref:PB1 domain-containing protein n=1 Tax=Heracleum sosnowskyi TaxID=360622 RepID=A0AAD8MHQ8_9APIA|nr:PB1 domain-containing protein [Heracleum sosnowskyi]